MVMVPPVVMVVAPVVVMVAPVMMVAVRPPVMVVTWPPMVVMMAPVLHRLHGRCLGGTASARGYRQRRRLRRSQVDHNRLGCGGKTPNKT